MKTQSRNFKIVSLGLLVAAMGAVMLMPREIPTIQWPSLEWPTFQWPSFSQPVVTVPSNILVLSETMAAFSPTGGLRTPLGDSILYVTWENFESGFCRIKVGSWTKADGLKDHWNNELQGSCTPEKVLGQLSEALEKIPESLRNLFDLLVEIFIKAG